MNKNLDRAVLVYQPDSEQVPDCKDCKYSDYYPNVKELCCIHPARKPLNYDADYHKTEFMRKDKFCGENGKRFEKNL